MANNNSTIRERPHRKIIITVVIVAVLAVLGFLLNRLDGKIAIVTQQPNRTATPATMLPTASALPFTPTIIATHPVPPNLPMQGERLQICGQNDICIIGPDGRNMELSLEDDYQIYPGFGFSPNGSQIVFNACLQAEVQQNPAYEFCHDLFIANREGNVTRLTNIPNIPETYPSWSPDDEWIAVGGWSLSIIRPDGTGFTELVSDPAVGNVYASAWSPDSQWIAFVAGDYNFDIEWGFQNEVSIINRDGSRQRMIFKLPDPRPVREDWITEIAWSPDGQSVAIQFADGRIYLVDADCEADADDCQLANLIKIPEIRQEWLDTFHPQWGNAVLYEEDFEDGNADGLISVGAYWKVVSDGDGNKVYEVDTTADVNGSTIEFDSNNWVNYSMEYQVKMLNSDADIWVSLGNYTQRLSLKFGHLGLYSSPSGDKWQPLAEPNYDLLPNVWYIVRVEVQNHTVRVYINDNLEIEEIGLEGLGRGNIIAIGNLGDTHAYFDDVRVVALDETTANVLNPQAEQARVFAEPILQAIENREPDFEDDFSIPNSRWYWIMSNDKGETALRGNLSADNIKNDAFTFTLEDGLYGSVAVDDCNSITNFVMQADLVDDGTANGGEFSIHWHVQSNADHYRFTIWLNLIPSWEVAYWVAGIRAPLASGTEKLNERGTSNQVLIVTLGSQFAIYLNGSPLTYFEDSQLKKQQNRRL